MKRRVAGIVEAITAERAGVQELLVRMDDAEQRSEVRPAINLTELTGTVASGDRVQVNTVAIELGLGTGGFDFVTAVLDRPECEYPAPGHILKLRYTPLQTPVLAVEAPESPYHDRLCDVGSLEETPVVCAELHSQIAPVCIAADWALKQSGLRPPRIAYIMTDTSALPIALSRLVPQLKELGLIVATITAGQAFGGDYEAITLYSALLAAKRIVEADIIVVAQGPGNAGTETALGFSGIAQGEAINAADTLGGVPVAVTRISFADLRDRHHGLSHHTVTILRHIARAPALVPIPRLPENLQMLIAEVLEETGIADRHQPITVDADRALAALEASGLDVRTMGRSIAQERPFFLAASAAGLIAAQLVEARCR